jgi:hypothetical protein
MTRKVYQSAQGKIIDLGALQLQNEHVRAVGNMNVNARGDIINADNSPIATRNQQVSKQYNRQTTNVSDTGVSKRPVPDRNKHTLDMATVPSPPEDFNDDFDRTTAEDKPVGGLAAAIARAREVTQDNPTTK